MVPVEVEVEVEDRQHLEDRRDAQALVVEVEDQSQQTLRLLPSY
jgi:hypothetical protein